MWVRVGVSEGHVGRRVSLEHLTSVTDLGASD
jgi:hypothetical protein